MRNIIALCAFIAGSVSAQQKTTFEAATAVGEQKMELMYHCFPKDGRPYWRDRPCAEAPEDLIRMTTAWAPKGVGICEQLKYIYRDTGEKRPIMVPIK
jgi:hypothetical protein